MFVILAFISGLLFGFGLILSGMAHPDKVLHFLDLSHAWDPSLAFVMMGAILVGVMGFAWAKRRRVTFFNTPLTLPANKKIDLPLVTGAAIFGIGWGMAGICPGPSLVLVGSGVGKGVLFLVAMLLGMWVVDKFQRK